MFATAIIPLHEHLSKRNPTAADVEQRDASDKLGQARRDPEVPAPALIEPHDVEQVRLRLQRDLDPGLVVLNRKDKRDDSRRVARYKQAYFDSTCRPAFDHDT